MLDIRVTILCVLCIVASGAARVTGAQRMTGSDYTVPQNTSGNIAVYTITNDYLDIHTFYFRCAVTGKVTACQAPGSVTLAPGAQATVNATYSTGTWGSGTLLVAPGNQFGLDEDVGHTSMITVTSPPQPAIVSAAPQNEYYLNPAGCAAGCFHAGASYSTPAYVSGGVARSVTLVYSSGVAAPTGLAHLEVTNNSSTPADRISIQLRRNGATITPEIFYQSGFGTSRMAAQFDADTTGLYAVEAIVKSYWGTNPPEQTSTTLKVPVIGRASAVGVGWRILGVQRLVTTSLAAVVVDQGDGSLVRFDSSGSCTSTCTYTSPIEFSRVTYSTASGDTVPWVRHYPDSSRLYFRADGRMSYHVDRAGNRTALTYAIAEGQLVVASMTDPYGKVTQFTYEGAGGSWKPGTLRAIITPGNRWSAFGVDGNGDLRHLQDPDGVLAWQMTYDAAHRLTTRLDRRGNSWRYAYDFTGRVAADSFPAVPIDGGALQTPVVRFVAPITRVLVNTASGLGTWANPAPRVDPSQLVGSITDPGGHAMALTVDAYGLPVRVTAPFGLATTITRSGLRPTRIDYPTGMWRTYNWSGPYVVRSDASGSGTIHLRYGAKGQVDSVWGTNRTPLRFFLSDANGRVDSVRYAGLDSMKARYFYASAASIRLDSIRDPKGHTTRLHYDATTGNVDSVLTPGQRFTRSQFDGYGRTISSWTNEGIRSVVEYDVLNRVIKSFAGTTLTDTMRYEYDAGLLKRLRDAKGNIYRFEYDAIGQLINEFDPADTLTRYTRYGYGLDGLVSRVTNRRGQTVQMTYDSLHRPLTRSGTAGQMESATYGYNALGTVRTAWNTISRDSIFTRTNGWTDSVVTRLGGHRFRRRYVPTAELALDSVTFISTTSLQLLSRSYIFNSGTRALEGIRVGSFETRYAANADGQSYSRTWPNGIGRTVGTTTNHQVGEVSFSSASPGFNDALWQAYEYDDLSRVTQATTRSATGSNYTTYYNFDAVGRLTSRQENTGTSCVQRDDGEVSCTSGLRQTLESFRYDSVGNRGDRGGQYAPANRLSTFQGRAGDAASYTYVSDLDGNITRKYRTDDALEVDRRYDWSADGLLRQVWIRHRGTPDDSLQYAYNALGQLVRRSRGGVVDRYYVWNGDNLWLTLNASFGRIAEYEYEGLDQPSTLITTRADGALLLRYFERDALGRVFAVTSDTTIAQRVSYDAWGWPESIQGLADTSRLLWKGLLWEGDSAQLYYMRNRWYDPGTGRFLSEDPIGLAGGINKYLFAGDDPVNGWDPYGLETCWYELIDGVWVKRCQTTLETIRVIATKPNPDHPLYAAYIGAVMDALRGNMFMGGSGGLLGAGAYEGASETRDRGTSWSQPTAGAAMVQDMKACLATYPGIKLAAAALSIGSLGQLKIPGVEWTPGSGNSPWTSFDRRLPDWPGSDPSAGVEVRRGPSEFGRIKYAGRLGTVGWAAAGLGGGYVLGAAAMCAMGGP